jgi:putative DNA primase/helicase
MTEEISAKDRLDAALAYAARGWRVVPVYEPRDGRCTCKKGGACDSPGKHPWLTEWPTKATTDPKTIAAWLTERPTTNLGIATGADSEIIAPRQRSPPRGR